mgnify:CR=1 FL=1
MMSMNLAFDILQTAYGYYPRLIAAVFQKAVQFIFQNNPPYLLSPLFRNPVPALDAK